MKCRRWILANSQEIISERAAFHYWRSGKSKEIKQTVYYSEIPEEAGAVLSRGWLWRSDRGREIYLWARKHSPRMRLARLMPDDGQERVVPGPEEAAVLRGAVPGCGEARRKAACAQHLRGLLPWVRVHGSPPALCPVLEQPQGCTPAWTSSAGHMWERRS